ncbi:hypothetical protein N9A04_00365 [Rickettsiales bacterium]|nr:hypothetical protein [Rickettsiales bacterium]
MHYGSKTTWSQYYVLTDINEKDLDFKFIVTSFYNKFDQPMNIISLTTEECLMNDCRPDIIISKEISSVQESSKFFELSKFHTKTTDYVTSNIGSRYYDDKIMLIYMWKNTPMYFGLFKTSKNLKLSERIIKNFVSDECLTRYIELEDKILQIKEIEAKNKAKAETMQNMMNNRGRPLGIAKK